MKFVVSDGGRKAAGFKGDCGDCVVRAVAIATQLPYEQVYAELTLGVRSERRSRVMGRKRQRSPTVRYGVSVHRKWFKDYMQSLGWKWTPTMGIGTGCRVHLTDGELPKGRLIVSLSHHYTTVINGVIYDTHDPQRGESRCVYGYWSPKS